MTALPSQSLKRRLASKERQLVVNIDYSNASLVQFLARELADVVFIDCEQGDTSIESIPDLVRASHLENTPALLRLPDPLPSTIERYMLRGVDGIVVPRLESPAQARDVVDTVRYCFGETAASKTIVVQIESENAAHEIDQFLEIAEIDAYFVGPVDLARSMGAGNDYRAEPVAGEVDRLIDRISKAGRSAGMLVNRDTIHRYERAGARFLYLHTNDFLLHGAQCFAPRPAGETLSADV